MNKTLASGITVAVAGFVAFAAAPVKADAMSDFYKENRVRLAIGFSPGGGFDRGGRVVGRHINKYIPGHPTIVVQNMPGGGSLRVLNWIFAKAPKDGTAFGHFHPAAVREELLGGKGVLFKAREFTWIGSFNRERAVTFVRADSGIKTIQDAMKRSVVIGATSPRSGGGSYPRIINNVLGTKFDVIVGYGSTGESTLAMERGEVQGIGSWSWSQLKTRKKKWIKNKFVNVLIHVSIAKHPDLPNVPTPLDLARNQEERDVLEMIFGFQEMGRPFAAPPRMPADKAKVLRSAFDQMVKQEDFKKEIEIAGLEVSVMDHKEVDAFLKKIYSLPPKVINRGKTVYAEMRSAKLSKAKLKSIKGAKVTKVSSKKGTRIQLDDGSGTKWKFKLSRRSKVKIAGKKAKGKALKAGMTCDVTFYGNGGMAYTANCK
jgi:tripartite-type tricarboxylate transporter receptor subunit TctC